MTISGKYLQFSPDRRTLVLLGLMLAATTVLVYWPAFHCDFIFYDDDDYFFANPQVLAGLSWKNVDWAFTTGDAGNWHPLTWLSLMLDVTLFGKNAAGPHFTNVLLHTVNVVLLFCLLRQLTGAVWRSALVAALFAWHPLTVESVAWVSERKSVLSTAFGLCSLLMYARYAQEGVAKFWLSWRYWLAWLSLVLGLMSKQMLVTWPFVMLLLDFWPLGRWQPSRARALILEKVPFFAVAAAAALTALVVQKHGGAMEMMQNLPLSGRVENAVIAYGRYLAKLFWPVNLAVYYPHPGYWPLEQVLLVGALLTGLSVALFLKRKTEPAWLVGWLWFGGTLVPVIGLVQVGSQSMADRYAYIPAVGVWITIIWGACELTRHWRFQIPIARLAGAAAIIFCLFATRQELEYWQNSETLFRHALQVTEDNWMAHNSLGTYFYRKGQIDEALDQFQQAVQLAPDYAEARNNLGAALAGEGRFDDALDQFQEVVRLLPGSAMAHKNLGFVLGKKGRTEEAVGEFQEALRLDPNYAGARDELGVVWQKMGRTEDAIRQFQQATEIDPGYAKARNDLGIALVAQGQIDAAVDQFQQAIRAQPYYAEPYNNLGYLWVKRGEHLAEARTLLETAVKLNPKNSAYLDSLGRALFKLNQPAEALNYLLEAIANAHPPRAAIYDHLGDAYAALHQPDQAAESWRKSLSLATNPQVQQKLAALSLP